MKFEIEETKREIFNLRTTEDNKPIYAVAHGRVIGMEFNIDTQETEIMIEYDKFKNVV